MWTVQHQGLSSATLEQLFALFSDVSSWPLWNAGVSGVVLDGPFATGTTGVMAMPDGRSLAFTLLWVIPERGFEDETQLPDANVVVRVAHTLDVLAEGGTRITYSCVIEGPDAAEIGPLIGPEITGDFPEVIGALSARAEAA